MAEVVYRGVDTVYTVTLADGQPCRVRTTNSRGACRKAVVGDTVRLAAEPGAFHRLEEVRHAA